MTMHTPTESEIETNFEVLDSDYVEDEFYGGAFEGSHVYADVVIFHLYSIVPDETDASATDNLRIETRHHVAGQVIEHDQEVLTLTSDLKVGDSGQSVATFCREHHTANAYEKIVNLCDRIEGVES